jgi:SAM-dependent methyltransferase
MQSTIYNTTETKLLAEILEEEWEEQSEALEEKHFEAAFEAKVAEIDTDATRESATMDNHSFEPLQTLHLQDHISCRGNRNKSNCFSPYVPSNSLRIHGMIDFVQFRPTDVFCDMGCGDGRVCFVVAATQYLQQQQHLQQNQDNESMHSSAESYNKFRAIGIDVSRDCIDMAKQHLRSNRNLSNDVKDFIQFYQADLTIHPNELLNGILLLFDLFSFIFPFSDPTLQLFNSFHIGNLFSLVTSFIQPERSRLKNELLSVTVIYLYTYPTLLIQLIPLLSYLFINGQLRAVVTLTYHIHHLQESTTTNAAQQNWTYELDRISTEHDLCLYTNILMQPTEQ